MEAINAAPAYIFRKVSDPDGLPTILYDEIDTLFDPRRKTTRKYEASSTLAIGAARRRPLRCPRENH